ncbi:MAG: IclR family transcriptional regulator [Pseudomonadota bacterium]
MATDPHSPADDSVTAVTRALALLDAFGVDDARLGLAELSRRAGIPKTSTLRIARTLAAGGYLVALDGGAWRLGPATARLGARYQRAFDLANAIEPVLQQLAADTGHSASFFAQEEGQRVRLLRIRGADGFVSPTRVGEPLPLDRGAPGLVLLAFGAVPAPGALFDTIRTRGYHLTIGEADVGAASVAAPVFGRRGVLAGALCIAVRAAEAKKAALARYAPAVVEAARRLSTDLAVARDPSERQPVPRGYWHP